MMAVPNLAARLTGKALRPFSRIFKVDEQKKEQIPDDEEGSKPRSEGSEPRSEDRTEKVERSPQKIQNIIKERQRNEMIMKQGVHKRYLGQARSVLACLGLMLATTVSASSAFEVRRKGAMRPDVVEVFANHAEISMTAHAMGLNATQPYDAEFGCDFYCL